MTDSVTLDALRAELGGRIAHLEAQLSARPPADPARDIELRALRTLADSVPAYVYVKDRQSRFLLANQATARLLGAGAAGDLLGKTDLDFFPRTMAEQFYREEQRLMDSGAALVNHEEMVIDGSSGERRWNLSTKIPLRDEGGGVVGLVGINWDVTDRRRAEEAARAAAVQEELIRAQTSLIEELSTPLLALSDRVLLLPLIGAVRPQRAQRMMEVLGEGVVRHGAERVILDLTGAEVADVEGARWIDQAATVVRLLGAELVLCGLSPAMARRFLEILDAPLAVKTFGSLQSAVAATLGQQARQSGAANGHVG